MQELTGTGVAIITPFRDNATDFDALGKVIDHILNNGVNYIVTLGTTGETPVLSMEEKIEIVNFTHQYIQGRCPLIIGVGGNYTEAVLREMEQLPLQKAIAILSACPYYNKPSQQGLYEHYKNIAEASPVPVILYNVPGRSGRNIDAATTVRLAKEVKNICAIKEAGGDMQQCMQILKDAPADFTVVSGDDALALPQIACGMKGVISVVANCYPAQFTRMVNACLNNDFASAKKINDSLIPAYELLFEENNPAGVKAFMAEMKLIENELRLPLVPLSENIHKQVKKFIQHFD